MQKTNLYMVVLLGLMVVACTPERKSANYYQKNRQPITEIRQLYAKLYAEQPFSVGFTDRSFKYYVAEVKTDTVRYIYNTEKNKEQVAGLISKFNYDTSLLKQLSAKMKQAKCLWISRTTFYVDMKAEPVTVLSFKSALIEKPFQENKYYMLMFPEHKLTSSPGIKQKIANGEIVKIEDGVYFSITSKFR